MIIKKSQQGFKMASPHRHRTYPGVEVKLVGGGRGFRQSTDITSTSS